MTFNRMELFLINELHLTFWNLKILIVLFNKSYTYMYINVQGLKFKINTLHCL